MKTIKIEKYFFRVENHFDISHFSNIYYRYTIFYPKLSNLNFFSRKKKCPHFQIFFFFFFTNKKHISNFKVSLCLINLPLCKYIVMLFIILICPVCCEYIQGSLLEILPLYNIQFKCLKNIVPNFEIEGTHTHTNIILMILLWLLIFCGCGDPHNINTLIKSHKQKTILLFLNT